ncbi:MAG: MATE family efflux transporter [Lapillicoccus sp.]
MSVHAPTSVGDQTTTHPSPRREIARIAVPVSAEFVLTLLLQVVNQVIVGLLGATAIAAVGFANSLSMILVLTLGALGASVSILVARAFGAGQQDRLNRTVTAAILLAGGAGVLAAVPLLLWGTPLMRLVGASETVAAAGGGYLGFLGLALVPIVVGGLLSGVLRSTGKARSPMLATMGTVGLNAALAFALVTGFGPFPTLGVVGAGVATLVTATIKTGILALQLFVLHRIVAWELPRTLAEWLPVARSLFVLAVPLGLTELFWTGGTFLYNVVFQRLGDAALAAAQIVNMLEALFLVGSIGLMSATTALVGREVGRGDPVAAAAWVRRIKKVGTVSGIAFGLLYGATALLLPVLFPHTGDEVRTMAVVGIALYAVSQVVKVRNMILGAGVLPSANDVRGVILGDVTGAFAVGLPLAVVLGLFTPLGFVGIFVARVVEELVKVAIFSRRTHQVRWDTLTASGGAARPGTLQVAREAEELAQLA